LLFLAPYLTKGQRAMAVAMMYSESGKGGHGKKDEGGKPSRKLPGLRKTPLKQA
jgi:hypothetical protein